MTINKVLKKIGFTSEWFELNLIDEEIKSKVLEKYKEGEDKNYEHYRHYAFKEFMKKNQPLSKSQIHCLYEIGIREEDKAMGSTILFTLMHLDNCPREITNLILKSDMKRLHKYAKKILKPSDTQ